MDTVAMRLQKGKARMGHVVRFPVHGWFAVTPVALESSPLRKMLEEAGELMPVTVEGEAWQLFHCTKQANPEMIDEALSGERDWGRIKTWAVQPEHLPTTGSLFVFKRKDHSIPRLFTTSRSNFKPLCEALGIQGIKFIPRWSQDPRVKVVPE